MSSRSGTKAETLPVADVLLREVPAGRARGRGADADARRRTWALMLCDVAIVLIGAWVAPFAARLAHDGPEILPRAPFVILVALGALPFLWGLGLQGASNRINPSGFGDIGRVLQAMSLYGFVVLLLLHAAPASELAPTDADVFAFWAFMVLALPIARAAVRHWVIPHVSRPQRVVVVGAGQVGQTVVQRIQANPALNLEVVGFVDADPAGLDPAVADVPVLGPEDDLAEIARRHDVDRVIVSFSRVPTERLIEVLRRSRLDQVHVNVVPRFFEIMTSAVELDDVAGIPVLDLRPVTLSRRAMITKRAMDLTLVILALPILVPVFIAVAIAIKLDSRGPVFFRQLRMGHHNRPFRIIKFRTMVVGAEQRRSEVLHLNQLTGPLFKMAEDPRVTRVGRFLRRTSLDELPQLINVLRGEMSLVGPRPFVVYEDREITGWARRRLDLIPGVTGVWQVAGRNDVPFEEMVKLDYLYVTRWSLGWDLKLLIQTVPSVLRRKGAY